MYRNNIVSFLFERFGCTASIALWLHENFAYNASLELHIWGTNYNYNSSINI